MTSTDKTYIIGIGDDGLEGLTEAARHHIESAELLVAAPKTMAAVANNTAERFELGGDLDPIVEKLANNSDKHTVVLMTGDPLFYGTARYLCERLGKDRFEVLPHVSSMQLAFARVKENWDEAYLANLATQGLERAVERIRSAETVGLFTSEKAPPSVIARMLLDHRIDYFTCYVCENLGSPDECVTNAELKEVAEQDFGALNVMILVRKPDRPDRPSEASRYRLFGNPDEAFLQSKPKRGLLTPAEVRCAALAELDLWNAGVVWDVGAGSGSVAVEAAQIASSGVVYAIEMDAEDLALVEANAEKFAVQNLQAILGKAPEAWQELPDPDAIFVGGTGRQVSRIVELAFERLRSGGRIVANVSSIENVAAVREVLHQKTDDDRVWMFNISRGVYQIERVRFESLNPTFLIGAVKP